jgi:hypothetical protein
VSHLTRSNVPAVDVAVAVADGGGGGGCSFCLWRWACVGLRRVASLAGNRGGGWMRLGYRGRLRAASCSDSPQPARNSLERRETQDTRLRGSSTCLRTATAWVRGGGGCVAAAGPNSVLGRLVQCSAGVTSAAPRPGRFHFLAGGCGFHLTGVLGG